MKVDVYDTYATGPDGAVMHFYMLVPAGTPRSDVLRTLHDYVGVVDPEIETERSRCRPFADANLLDEIDRSGFSILPFRRHNAAA